MLTSLTAAEQLVLRDARPADAVMLDPFARSLAALAVPPSIARRA